MSHPNARIAVPELDALPAASRPPLEAAGRNLGMIPNMYKLFGLSTPALDGYLGLTGALSRTLDVRTRERIALAVAEANGCDYCLSAHSYIAEHLAKLDPAEIALARHGGSVDQKAAAAVRFARQVAETRGKVADTDLATLRSAGYGDQEIVEIVANVALNVLTNLLNNVARTDIDFPVVTAAAA